MRDGKYDQFVAATGPILLGPVVHQSQSVPADSESRMSSKDRVRLRLRGVTPEIIRKAIDCTADFQVHNSASVIDSKVKENRRLGHAWNKKS